MLRWASSVSLASLAAFALLITSTPTPPPSQPVRFNHKLHLDYFWGEGEKGHRPSMVSMHEELLEKYKDGRHGQTMVARHKEILLKELQDEEVVAGILGDVEQGYCTTCHRDYDDNARDLAKLSACSECHRRKDQDGEKFVGQMIVDIQNGRCTLCHGDFDRNAENVARLGHCGECHRVFLGRDWEGRVDQRPCIGCHNAVVRTAQASIPDTNTCAACHLPALGHDREEMKLVGFIEQEKMIFWNRVYDRLPGEVVFSHERHVELGRVRCQECHGPVEEAVEPPSIKVGMSMEDCIACHQLFGADDDCLACHR